MVPASVVRVCTISRGKTHFSPKTVANQNRSQVQLYTSPSLRTQLRVVLYN